MACVFEQIAYISAYLFLIVDFQEFLFGLRAADVYGKLADSVFLAVVWVELVALVVLVVYRGHNWKTDSTTVEGEVRHWLFSSSYL